MQNARTDHLPKMDKGSPYEKVLRVTVTREVQNHHAQTPLRTHENIWKHAPTQGFQGKGQQGCCCPRTIRATSLTRPNRDVFEGSFTISKIKRGKITATGPVPDARGAESRGHNTTEPPADPKEREAKTGTEHLSEI